MATVRRRLGVTGLLAGPLALLGGGWTAASPGEPPADLVADLRPTATGLGCAEELEGVLTILDEGPSYLRQRRLMEDGGDLRYGEATVHAEHGVPVALNAGDLLLGRDARLQEELRADPSLIPAFIEETLRLESPFYGHFRQATLAGHTDP